MTEQVAEIEPAIAHIEAGVLSTASILLLSLFVAAAIEVTNVAMKQNAGWLCRSTS